MSTLSVVRAIQLKFAGLSLVDFPKGALPALYFDQAPQVDSTASQVQVTTQGYVVLKHLGTEAKPYAFGGDTLETSRIDFEVYYPSLGDCLMAAEAIKGAFDYGGLPNLGAPLQLLAMRPRSSRPAQAGVGKDGKPVHQWDVGYTLQIVRLAA